ncbi:fimbrial protein [Pseudomonas cichorii]|uniref:fimbrial protein n=1 Tax=Pseudomonas cichorii TaxID=36746 RepID=UPI0018E6627D|nr:fimbrial protein [Pseudomonas cichorii]MBI6853146.1 fimbrial protein [Pseudomonas cichorii]
MKALIWMLLVVTSSVVAQTADNLQVEVSGKLVSPPCLPDFASSMEVKLGDTNLNQLKQDIVPPTEVPLTFRCRPNSRLTLLLSAGVAGFDSQTLRTSREGLGLRLVGSGPTVDFSLGQPSNWTAGDVPLVLTLRVKPVALDGLPEPGAFSATLLMQIVYL